jgi:hypothetical protein
MTVQEIITLFGLLLPIAYGLGRVDESAPTKNELYTGFFVVLFLFSIISTTVALTLRFIN